MLAEQTIRIKNQDVGLAYINGFRCIFSAREIRRGKKKGMVEVTYRKGSKIKKTLLAKKSIRKYPNGG
uniref:Uncharacterized protein n=1 Tax=viral metagenome TaxID=1070528 RepID=A0A6M3IN96_9ZZZZ